MTQQDIPAEPKRTFDPSEIVIVTDPDQTKFTLTRDSYRQSLLIRHLIEDIGYIETEPVPLFQVNARTFKIIDGFMNKPIQWDPAKFERQIPLLLIASQYLEMEELTSRINNYIKSKIQQCTNAADVIKALYPSLSLNG